MLGPPDAEMRIHGALRLLESGTKVGELERILAAETGLPLRYAKDAVAEARQLIASQKVLVKEHLQLWQRREKKTAARIHKIARQDSTSRKLPGLRSKLEKQQRKAAFYQQHAEQSTFPPVIFGSRELYLSQFKEGVNQAAWRYCARRSNGAIRIRWKSCASAGFIAFTSRSRKCPPSW